MKITKLALERIERKINERINILKAQWLHKHPKPIQDIAHVTLLELALNDPVWRRSVIHKFKDKSRWSSSIESCPEQLRRDSPSAEKAYEANRKKIEPWEKAKSDFECDLERDKQGFLDRVAVGEIKSEDAINQVETAFSS